MTQFDLTPARRISILLEEVANDCAPEAARYLRNSEIPCLESLPARLDTATTPVHYLREVAQDLSGVMFIAGHSLRRGTTLEWAREDGVPEQGLLEHVKILKRLEADGVVTGIRNQLQDSELEELALDLRGLVLGLLATENIG